MLMPEWAFPWSNTTCRPASVRRRGCTVRLANTPRCASSRVSCDTGSRGRRSRHRGHAGLAATRRLEPMGQRARRSVSTAGDLRSRRLRAVFPGPGGCDGGSGRRSLCAGRHNRTPASAVRRRGISGLICAGNADDNWKAPEVPTLERLSEYLVVIDTEATAGLPFRASRR